MQRRSATIRRIEGQEAPVRSHAPCVRLEKKPQRRLVLILRNEAKTNYSNASIFISSRARI